MRARNQDQRGDTLMEIVIAMVVIGLVVGAFMATYTTASTGSTAHRALVTGDGLLRSHAEALKSAVRNQCASSSSYTTTTTSLPAGYSMSSTSTPAGQSCPLPAALQEVTYTVTLPNGQQRSLLVEVRSP